jgi:Restriction endonuclease
MDPFDPALLKSLLDACESAIGSHARGAALENLVQHVFTASPSVKLYERDVKDQSGAQEIDLVFSHLFSMSLLPIPDVTIITECKNERKKTSSAHIFGFAAKLQTRSANIGVFVTAAGLSGKPRPETAAHAAIRDALAGGISIIVVTAEEVSTLSSADELAVLLRDRLMELRTFRSYRSI